MTQVVEALHTALNVAFVQESGNGCALDGNCVTDGRACRKHAVRSVCRVAWHSPSECVLSRETAANQFRRENSPTPLIFRLKSTRFFWDTARQTPFAGCRTDTHHEIARSRQKSGGSTYVVPCVTPSNEWQHYTTTTTRPPPLTDLEVFRHVLRKDVDHPKALVQAFRGLPAERRRVGAGGVDDNGFIPGQTKASAGGLLDARHLLGCDTLLLHGGHYLRLPDHLWTVQRNNMATPKPMPTASVAAPSTTRAVAAAPTRAVRAYTHKTRNGTGRIRENDTDSDRGVRMLARMSGTPCCPVPRWRNQRASRLPPLPREK